MAKIALITDSTTYLPPELSKGYDIHVVPSLVIWAGKELRDGFDIQPSEFYKQLASASDMPTTSQPSPAAFKDKFEELKKNGFTDILCLCVSAKLSGTIASAQQAKGMVSGVNVEIVDGKSASMGTGWPLLEAAKAAKAGKSLAECAEIARKAGEHVGVMLLVDTLEFLHRGGRIGGGARFLGTALNLKPILEIQDGALEAVERVRTKSKAVDRLVELAEERIAGRSPVHLAVLHANVPDDAKALLDQASKRIKPIETALADVSPAVGTHTGPGTMGIAFMAGYK
ncbi:MAG TPA: DegV family protein [Terriglobales bacterium]|nr:DegV family protein [Terriglobales bacterium]